MDKDKSLKELLEIELSDDEEITDELVAEFSDGKGDEDE